MDGILAQWDAFAGSQLPAAAHMTPSALRDHAKQILLAVAKDLATPQTDEEQAEKSKGRAPILFEAPETAAETHALAESIRFFSNHVEQARNLLLGMVGHDMRTPLQTIQLTASYLAALNAGAGVSDAATLLINSGGRIQALLDDLVDLNRSSLGLGIHIVPTEVDVAVLFADELKQLQAAYPGRRLELQVSGDARGVWDGLRLQQLLANLVVNAIIYGAADAPVRVVVVDEGADLYLEVRNAGAAIDPESLVNIFNPLTRGAQKGRTSVGSHLGLGLHIAHEIVAAHGGAIEARSEPEEAVFAVRLPKTRS